MKILLVTGLLTLIHFWGYTVMTTKGVQVVRLSYHLLRRSAGAVINGHLLRVINGHPSQ